MNNYPPAPAGKIEAEIVAASIGEVAWKASDDNPKGECLRLRLRPEGNYAFVFADVPLDWGRMLENVRAAAGISGEAPPEAYVGCRVRVVLKHYQAKDGSTRATVARWLPAQMRVDGEAEGQKATLTDAVTAWEQQPAPLATAAAKPSRNAVPKYVTGDDEIPF